MTDQSPRDWAPTPRHTFKIVDQPGSNQMPRPLNAKAKATIPEPTGLAFQLFSERSRVVARWIDLKRSSREARHGKTAGQCHQRHQALDPHRHFRRGISFVAKALVCEQFARHDIACSL